MTLLKCPYHPKVSLNNIHAFISLRENGVVKDSRRSSVACAHEHGVKASIQCTQPIDHEQKQ